MRHLITKKHKKIYVKEKNLKATLRNFVFAVIQVKTN